MRFSLNKEPAVERREISDLAMTLELPHLPPSTNNLYFNLPSGGGRAPTRAYKDWLWHAGLILNRQITGKLRGRVDILIKVEDKHPARDASNTIKPIEDLLVKCGAIHNDNAKFVRSVKAEWANIDGVRIEIRRAA